MPIESNGRWGRYLTLLATGLILGNFNQQFLVANGADNPIEARKGAISQLIHDTIDPWPKLSAWNHLSQTSRQQYKDRLTAAEKIGKLANVKRGVAEAQTFDTAQKASAKQPSVYSYQSPSFVFNAETSSHSQEIVSTFPATGTNQKWLSLTGVTGVHHMEISTRLSPFDNPELKNTILNLKLNSQTISIPANNTDVPSLSLDNPSKDPYWNCQGTTLTIPPVNHTGNFTATLTFTLTLSPTQ